jgi:uncharacterized protein (DUF302 family)
MDAFEATLDGPLADAEARVRRALSKEGFGILTEIDVAATLKMKLGVHRPPLKILGTCNPSLAHRALSLDPSLALLLPCNVVLEDAGENRTRVTIADPRAVLTTGGNESDALVAFAAEASSALERAVARLTD